MSVGPNDAKADKKTAAAGGLKAGQKPLGTSSPCFPWVAQIKDGNKDRWRKDLYITK